MDILTAAAIRAVEEKENQIGAAFPELMSRAGKACADVIMERFPKECGSVVVVCGKGKNGGDGFVIARKLHNADYDVSVVLAFGEPTAEDAVTNYKKAIDAGIPIIPSYPDHAYADQLIAR
ncbi:MAG TPA: NAD(P)H-hydrate epimerase, partial [Clostridiales bacterium]|nr:NAD(P)H-hydrate epimerase [Clostridiales bacterium]